MKVIKSAVPTSGIERHLRERERKTEGGSEGFPLPLPPTPIGFMSLFPITGKGNTSSSHLFVQAQGESKGRDETFTDYIRFSRQISLRRSKFPRDLSHNNKPKHGEGHASPFRHAKRE